MDNQILQIRLFGEFQLAAGNALISKAQTPRMQSLLAYLLLNGDRDHSRQRLSFFFWPDLPEAQSRNNLRQILHRLRLTLPNHQTYLDVEQNTVRWLQDSPFHLDVIDFVKSLETADHARASNQTETMRKYLEHAIALHQGDLLPSCYDDWISPHRERLRQQCLSALEEIATSFEEQREYSKAVSFARRLLQIDPLCEPGYRLLMRLYALQDDRTNALKTYRICEKILQRELSIEPDPSTQEMFEQLMKTQPASKLSSPRDGSSQLSLVGREAELSRLRSTWQQVVNGKLQFALLSGQAGIGKSRLADEMLNWLARQGFQYACARAHAAEGNLSFSPLADWLRSEVYTSALKMMEKVWLTEVSRLLPELLIDIPKLMPPEPLFEHAQRQRFFQALARALLSVKQPFLLFIDDLQWCDPETLAFLHYLLRFDAHARLLLIGTLRTGEEVANPALQDFLIHSKASGSISEIQLRPLDATETARMAENFTGSQLEIDKALDLYRETEGNPLFVVETLRSKEHTRGEVVDGKASALPDRVRAVIAARLAQFSSPARKLVGLAATIGRAFDLEVLISASGAEEDDLLTWLDEIWQRQIIRQTGESSYEFTHDKLREVGYAQVSPLNRRKYHQQAARALEMVYKADLDPVSGRLAYHFERSGRAAEAAAYYHRSALLNQRLGAFQEAVRLVRKSLDLLQAFQPGQERDQQELEYLTTLGALLTQSLSHGATQVIQGYERAQDLSQKLGRPTSPQILRALATSSITSARFRNAMKYGSQLLSISQNETNSALYVEAHYILGVSNFWLGEFHYSREHLEKAIARYEPSQSQHHTIAYTQDPRVICQVRLAFTLWCQGYPEKAIKECREALDYARNIGHIFSLAYATSWQIRLLNHLRNYDAARQCAEDLLKLCQEHHLVYWALDGLALLGWAQAGLGETEKGIDTIRSANADPLGQDYQILMPLWLSLLGEMEAKEGDSIRGLHLIDEALAVMEKNEEYWCAAELYRRKGEVLLRSGDTARAEAIFQRALSTARDQGAKMLELRSALQLSRLWQLQGKPAEAKQLLVPLHNWFREGWETVDLRELAEILSAL